MPKGVSETTKINPKNDMKSILWDLGMFLWERKMEVRMLFTSYFGNWPCRVCGSSWSLPERRCIFSTLRLSRGAAADFIDVRQARDTAAPPFGSWNAWIGLVIGASRCMANPWQVLADPGRFPAFLGGSCRLVIRFGKWRLQGDACRSSGWCWSWLIFGWF